MQRAQATRLVKDGLRNLDSRQGSWPLNLLTGLYVFGSFARGALDPHDVDLDIEHETSWDWANDQLGADMTLLWARGDSFVKALDRLHAIPMDPAAGRAPREAMLPEIEGLDRWLPLYWREQIIDAVTAGAITLQRITLPDVPPSRSMQTYLSRRWNGSSPLLRAASAVLGHWENRGIDVGRAHLHGQDVRDKQTPYFAGFGLRYLAAAPECLTTHGGTEWLEVVPPTKSLPLECLKILPQDAKALADQRW